MGNNSFEFFNPFGKKKIDVYKQQETGKIKYVKQSFAWPCLFFGYFWFLFKGMWSYFFLTLFIAWIILSLGEPIFYAQWIFFGVLAYEARGRYAQHLVSKGYKRIKTVFR